MQTNLDVANSALYDINVEPITSFDDPSKEARVVSAKFQSVLDEVMSTNPWNCNREIRLLNYTEVDELFGWKYAYTIPNDCLYVRAVAPLSDINQVTPETLRRFTEYSMNQASSQLYMKKGQEIFANDPYLLLVYSKSVKDCSSLPAYIAKAVSKCLAAEIAYPITQDRQIRADQLGFYDAALRAARAANAREENVYTPVSSLITTREG